MSEKGPMEGDSLRDLIKAAQSMAGDPHFVTQVNGRIYGELGSLAKHLNTIMKRLEAVELPVEEAVQGIPQATHQLADITKLTEEGTHRVMEYTETVMDNHDLMIHDLKALKQNLPPDILDHHDVKEKVAALDHLLQDNRKILLDLFTALEFQDLAAQRVKKIRAELQEVESRVLKLVVAMGLDMRGKSMAAEKQQGLLNELEASTKAERLDQRLVDDILKEFGF
jgi:chemotaxis regulatin CheY-phosphate phosphatase CheZ